MVIHYNNVFDIICIIGNVYWLFYPHNKSLMLVIINTITPVVTLIYLFSIIIRKKILIKELNEQIHKIFSKN